MSKYDLIVFDLDGTLTESRDVHLRLFNMFGQNRFPDMNIDQIGTNGGETVRQLFLQIGIPEQDLEKVFQELYDFYDTDGRKLISEITFADGALKLLSEIKEAGLKTALISNSIQNLIDILLEINGASDLFDSVLGANINTTGKVERFQTLADKYKVPLKNTIYIGDSELDAKVTNEFGIDCCILNTPIGWAHDIGNLIKTYDPTYVVNSLDKLKNIIL